MRGTVEVITIVEDGREEILYREDNLVVNEAGRTIVDMLTTPSSTLTYAPRLMDTSNWVVQAISFGKDSSAFDTNAHAGPSRRNLIKWSTMSSMDLDNVYANSESISSLPEESPPPGFYNIPSSVAHVVGFVDRDSDANRAVSTYVYFTDPPHEGFPNLTLSGADNLWMCYSAYIKPSWPENPFYSPESHPRFSTHFKLQALGRGYDAQGDGGIGKSRGSVDPRYAINATQTSASVSAFGAGFVNDKRYTSEGAVAAGQDPSAAGYGLNRWDSGNGVIPVGEGWYRMYTSILTPVSAVSSISCTVYPNSHDGNPPIGETSGGILTYGHQLEVGRYPTTLQFNNGVSTLTNWDFSGSVMSKSIAEVDGYDDSGTVRVSGSFYADGTAVSSYAPANWLDKYPDPLDKHISVNTQTGFGSVVSGPWLQKKDICGQTSKEYTGEMGSVLSSMDWGQNINMLPFRNQVNGDTAGKVFFDLFGTKENYYQYGKQQHAWLDVVHPQWQQDLYLSAMGQIGPQGYYLGCWAEGSGTGGTNWAMVSSLDNEAAYGVNGSGAMITAADPDAKPLIGNFDGGFNEASSMDVFGFVGKVYDHKEVVGQMPNPNLFKYTVNWADDPGVNPATQDYVGNYWHHGTNMMGSWSSIDFVNPEGGASSMYVSASHDPNTGGVPKTYALALAQHPVDDWEEPVNFHFSATNSYYQSIFVKRAGTIAEGYTSSMMIKIKDVQEPGVDEVGYINYIEYLDDGVVPTLKGVVSNYTTLTIEDAGNDWYRIINRVDGNNVDGNTSQGDRMTCYFYLGDTKAVGGVDPSRDNIIWTDGTGEARGKTLQWWGPQAEVHPTAYGISSTPYQAVSATVRTASENNGVYGLTVSSPAQPLGAYGDNGKVVYETTISSGDAGMSNLYGGVYNIALWTLDIKESLKNAAPPFVFDPLNNPIEYRLFSSKKFVDNITFIHDDLGATNPAGINAYTDIKIRWTLDFRSTGNA